MSLLNFFPKALQALIVFLFVVFPNHWGVVLSPVVITTFAPSMVYGKGLPLFYLLWSCSY
ncbi:hypothetical protein PORCRE_2030 [Porphyromonas crevioricanis JCM 15906]|uniref:Uncharacterized protein n=1 Tax=Porphyromonas crevioricanis JCM 15906 TaxID=1305617 RepID=T1DU69_9PORP|nr:hypothetical protein PORCRE_2030 [Porphyromonas crevioricanis JCM 15906]